jgi:hypothetical protein
MSSFTWSISDNMLAKYFPSRYPECIEEFQKGVDLEQFQQVPFIMNRRDSIPEKP